MRHSLTAHLHWVELGCPFRALQGGLMDCFIIPNELIKPFLIKGWAESPAYFSPMAKPRAKA